MEMAEKDDTEGRCPACRTSYDKEKIVGMAANCERLVTGINSERKQKSQKAKPKASEGRMHLSNVRVIQRNLVYIIGLPLNLADEDLLQRREYFGQYGKVLKVSISRTATGAIQHSSNNSCCVYITYSKEDEAIRCIQSVHSFILDDRPLRACFGTTKYCHAWLRNMPCGIPDCLYLHDFGSQEDSFTKDEIVSAFTRSRVQQIIGATNNMHRRSGNVLPAPADEHLNGNTTLTAKPIANNSSNNIENQNKGSCADIVTGKSNILPMATSWVMCVSATLPPNKHLSSSVRSPSNHPKTSNNSQIPNSEVVSIARPIRTVKLVEAEASSEVHLNSKLDPLDLCDEYIDGDCQIALLNTFKEASLDRTDTVTSKNHPPSPPTSKGSHKDIAIPSSRTSSLEHSKPFSVPASGEDENCHTVGDFQGLCTGLSSISLGHFKKEHSIPVPNSSMCEHFSVNLPENQGSQEENCEQFGKFTIFPASMGAPTMEGLLDFDYSELKGLEDIHHLSTMSSSPYLLHNLNQSSCLSRRPGGVSNYNNLDEHTRNIPMKQEVTLPLTSKNSISNGFKSSETSSFFNLDATIQHSRVLSEVELENYCGKYDSNAAPLHNAVGSDVGESTIISKILSLDSDAWEDSLTSPHSLVKLLSQNDKQHNSLKIPSLFKESDCRQSRFSFARQEEFSKHASNLEHSLGNTRHLADQFSGSNDWMKNKDIGVDKHSDVFSSCGSMESHNSPSSHSFISSVSKVSTSIPPGFAVPSRTNPPDFFTHGAMHKSLGSPAAGIGGRYGDGSFVDPAILEVGKGLLQAAGLNSLGSDVRQTSSLQHNSFDHSARLHLLMQQSNNGYQNLRFQDPFMNSFSPPNDTYGISSMLLNPSQPDNLSAFVPSTVQQFGNSHMSSGHWGSLNGVKINNNLGVSDLMTNRGLDSSNLFLRMRI